jgi:hypothetical protein
VVEWKDDEYPDLSWAEPEDREKIKEVLVATLKDAEGSVLASVGGIIDPDKNYGRVVEAELALQALSEK